MKNAFNTAELATLKVKLQECASQYRDADAALWEYCQAHPMEGIMNMTSLALKTRGKHPGLLPQAVTVGVTLAEMNDTISKICGKGVPLVRCLEVTRTILSPHSQAYV